MKWSKIKTINKKAVNDMCSFLAEKYSKEQSLHKDLFHFSYDRDGEITVISPKDRFWVSDGEIMDFLVDKWKIGISINWDLIGGRMCVIYQIVWIEKGRMYSSPLSKPFVNYKEAYLNAYFECFSHVNKKIK